MSNLCCKYEIVNRIATWETPLRIHPDAWSMWKACNLHELLINKNQSINQYVCHIYASVFVTLNRVVNMDIVGTGTYKQEVTMSMAVFTKTFSSHRTFGHANCCHISHNLCILSMKQFCLLKTLFLNNLWSNEDKYIVLHSILINIFHL